jgi:hypothetical protein
MNHNQQILPDFAEWIIRSLDGTISAEQFVMLDKEITNNSAARAYYLDFITTYVGLVDLVGVLPKPAVEKFEAHLDPIKTSLNFGPEISEEEKIHQIERYAEQQLKIFLAQQHRDIQESQYRDIGWNLSDTIYQVTETAEWLIKKGIKAAKTTAVCAFVAIVILIIIFNVYTNRTVATLVDSVDAKWNVEIGKDGRIPPARFRLEQGYARIALKKGAVVILQAPSTFKIQTRNKMFLETGWITAKVPPEALGFAVKTPVSNVVDFGTEFGIRVGQDGTSDLHLFKGKAILKWNTGIWSERTLTLTEGQAKRVDKSGQVEDIPIQQYSFVRHFNSETGFIWRGQRLSLVDIVGKGNGLGTGQTNVYVDPIEGYKESLYCSGKGNEYHTLAANLFIDGLFIPDGSKKQIVSSQAHEFADCPKTNGECYATLGANPIQGVWATDMRNGIIQFAGQDFGNREHPCIVMHANLGITFDLSAIRAMCPDIKMTHFVSQFGIADFNEIAGCNADFWVLIDGQVRESRRHVTQKNILFNVSIELSPSDRFLTLVTTDGGDIDRMEAYQRSYTCDWCVFLEPALILKTEEDTVISK